MATRSGSTACGRCGSVTARSAPTGRWCSPPASATRATVCWGRSTPPARRYRRAAVGPRPVDPPRSLAGAATLPGERSAARPRCAALRSPRRALAVCLRPPGRKSPNLNRDALILINAPGGRFQAGGQGRRAGEGLIDDAIAFGQLVQRRELLLVGVHVQLEGQPNRREAHRRGAVYSQRATEVEIALRDHLPGHHVDPQ